jgi:hypothetical protein
MGSRRKPAKRRAKHLACFAAALALTNCAPRKEEPVVDTIEIQISGWVGYNVIVHANGTGEFEGSPSLAVKSKKAFALKQGQFEKLASTLRPYLRYAQPVTDKSIRDIVEGAWPKCPSVYPRTMDAGALYLHWRGPRMNVHYLVDFGCDEQRNRGRNERLFDAVHQLPINQYLGPGA